MPSKSLVRAFVLQWWVAGAVLLFLSVKTAHAAVHAGHAHDPHAALLGAVEAISAVLFLVPRTMRAGAIGLLATFAIAFALHAAMGEFRGDLVLYAAVVTFVAVHGPVPMAWLRG